MVRALAILSSFDLDHSEVGVSQVAELVGLHKSTAHRLLQTLESQGFVTKTERSKYVLGRKIWSTSDEESPEARHAAVKVCVDVFLRGARAR